MRHQFVAIMATVLTLMPCHAQDALPAHAIARLGDTKWKYPYGPSGLRFVNAGRDLLVQCGDGSLRFTEIVTGTTFPPAHFQGQRVLAVSTNGETIVRLSEDERSFVFETIHGRRLGSTPRNGDSNFGHVNLVNDRQFVAWNEFASGEQSLILFDIDGPNRIVYDKTNRPPDLTKVTPLLAVLPSPEGKRLAIAVSDPAPKRYGGKLFTWKTDGGYSTTSLDIDICSVDGCRSVVAAFSADGRLIGTLYNGKILINDVREFKERFSIETSPKDVVQLAFSPDGKALAAQTAEGKIHVFDLGTRKALREIGERAPKSFPLAIRDIFALAWSPDSTLIAQAWGPGRIRIWNAESGRETTPVPNGHVGPVDQVFALASDENLMSVGSDRTVRTWNLRTKTQSRLVDLPSETRLARLVNPHRCFVTFDTWRDVDPAVAIWDVATWKEVATVKGPRPGNPGIFRSGDGSSVVIGNVFFGHGSGGEALILDSKSGDRLEGSQKYRHGEDQSLALLSKSPARGLVAYVIVKEKFIGFGLGPSLFPHIQCARNDGPVVWEIGSKTNDEWFSAHISAIEFSPDDRILVVKQWEGLTLYDSFTGRVRFEFSMPRNCFQIEHGFSKSGDLLAIASNDGTILVFDVRRGRQIERLVGGQGPVTSLEFVDSTTLFSGGADGTILVWDLRQARRDAKADRPTTDCDFRASWKALAEPDPKTANVAASKLIDSATETVLRLSGLVTQVKPLDQVQLAKDLTRLDDSKFEVRDQADAALRRAGALALPMLIEALKAPKSLEQKRRLTSLIESAKARSQIPDAEEMRQHRAIEILEAVGSDEAKAILSILADGAPESRITNDAIWALKRCKNAK